MQAGYSSQQGSTLQDVELFLLLLAVFFAPFETLRHPSLFFTLSDFFFCAALIVRIVVGFPLLPLGSATYVWLFGFVLLTFGLLISSLVNGEPVDALIVFVQYFFAFICLPYAILGRTYDQALLLIKCSIWSMMALCLFGIVAYSMGAGGGVTGHFVIVTGGGRLTSLVTNPNGFASVVAFTFPLLWFLMAVKQIKFGTAVVATTIFAVALILASSNTGFMIVVASALIFFLGQGRVKTVLVASAVFAVLGTVAVIWGEHIFPAVFQRRVLGALLSGELNAAGTFTDRYELIREAWAMAESNAFIGLGVNQYKTISEQGLAVHNTYLLLLNEGGVISLLGFLILLASFLMLPLFSIKKYHGYLEFVFTFSMVVAFAFVANSLTHVYGRYLIVPLMLAVGVTSSKEALFSSANRREAPL